MSRSAPPSTRAARRHGRRGTRLTDVDGLAWLPDGKSLLYVETGEDRQVDQGGSINDIYTTDRPPIE